MPVPFLASTASDASWTLQNTYDDQLRRDIAAAETLPFRSAESHSCTLPGEAVKVEYDGIEGGATSYVTLANVRPSITLLCWYAASVKPVCALCVFAMPSVGIGRWGAVLATLQIVRGAYRMERLQSFPTRATSHPHLLSRACCCRCLVSSAT